MEPFKGIVYSDSSNEYLICELLFLENKSKGEKLDEILEELMLSTTVRIHEDSKHHKHSICSNSNAKRILEDYINENDSEPPLIRKRYSNDELGLYFTFEIYDLR